MSAAARVPLIPRLVWTAGAAGNVLIMVWAAVLLTGRISDLALGRGAVRAAPPAATASPEAGPPAPPAGLEDRSPNAAAVPVQTPEPSPVAAPPRAPASAPAPTGEGVHVVGEKARFRYRNASARKVLVALYLSRTNLVFKEMSREGDLWALTLPMNPGRYRYSLVVDGRWLLDPGNSRKMSDGLGGWNSVVRIP